MPGLRVALLYNLKHNAIPEPGAPPDALAEYDSAETVQALEDALRAGGHQVIPLEGDKTLLDTIRQADPDIEAMLENPRCQPCWRCWASLTRAPKSWPTPFRWTRP
jgi:hypothetical protein